MAKLIKLRVVQNATQNNVTGDSNWATVQNSGSPVIVEATTAPKNNADEWKQINWDGAGTAVQGQANRRSVSRAASKVQTVKATLEGVSISIDIWVIWANVQIVTTGPRPPHAAPFGQVRDRTETLRAVTFTVENLSVVIDEKAGEFADVTLASGKVAPVATLTPPGIAKVIVSGWGFRRERFTHDWINGIPTKQFLTAWKDDPSIPKSLRLTPDSDDKIYDLDAPDIIPGTISAETYNNFRQWIEWNGDKCSDFALWHWQARWHVDRDPSKQITLKDSGTGNVTLPGKPFYPP